MLSSPLLATIPGLSHGFSSADEPPPSGFRHLHQVHSNLVIHADGRGAEDLAKVEADALYAREGVIGVRTADCIPVLITASDGSVFAAVHAGWRGLESGIILRAIDALRASELRAAIGPSIAACCYEVSRDVCDRFSRAWGRLWRGAPEPWASEARRRTVHARSTATPRESGIFIDLQRVARLQLESAGLQARSIDDLDACTYCGPPEYASYRRATHEGGAKRYQWSWIGRTLTTQ